jgi:hypothetical protein
MRTTILAALLFAQSGLAALAQTYPPPPPAPAPQQEPQPAPQPQPPQSRPQGGPTQFGLRCQTPQVSCNLPQPAAVGTTCFCNAPAGRFNGSVVQ